MADDNGKIQTQVVTRQFYMDVAEIIGDVKNDEDRELLIEAFGNLFSRRQSFSKDVFMKNCENFTDNRLLRECAQPKQKARKK